jgi:hypothetical protein
MAWQSLISSGRASDGKHHKKEIYFGLFQEAASAFLLIDGID